MKKVILNKSVSIGNVAAENDDDFLTQCFIDHGAITTLKDVSSSKSFALGSTGSGKTAILRKIDSTTERSNFIDLSEISLTFISNSDQIRFVSDLGVSLNLFFQTLWKHVLIMEYIRLNFDIKNEDKSRNVFSQIQRFFQRDSAKEEALAYLEKHSETFWITFDESFKEIESKFSNEISAEFGAEIEKFKTNAGFIKHMGELKRVQLQQRVQKVINSDMLVQLSRVSSTLSTYSERHVSDGVFILIDGLDEPWVDEKIKYQLIKALIETLKSLRKIQNLKVIVSIRSDVLEKVIEETKHDGFQTEKYEDYFYRISWTARDLQDLINKRINFLFRSKYDSQNIFLTDLFPDRVAKKKPIDYLLDRTLMRPRDLISFVNACFATSDNNPVLTSTNIGRAERTYSQQRKEAIVEEWNAPFPALEAMMNLIQGRRNHFTVGAFVTDLTLDNIATAFTAKNEYKEDSLFSNVEKGYSNADPREEKEIVFDLVQRILSRLHLTGVVGLNTHKEEPYHWFYKEQNRIPESSISLDARVRVHEMLHTALSIKS